MPNARVEPGFGYSVLSLPVRYNKKRAVPTEALQTDGCLMERLPVRLSDKRSNSNCRANTANAVPRGGSLEVVLEPLKACRSEELGEAKWPFAAVVNPRLPRLAKFRPDVKSLEGIGTPRSIYRRSCKTLARLRSEDDLAMSCMLHRTLLADWRAGDLSDQLTGSIETMLKLAVESCAEAEILNAAAHGYHALITCGTHTNTSQASVNETRRMSDLTSELCLRAVAMLRSCDYPLHDIVCLFAVAASQLEKVFAKLHVHDQLEKIYIGLLQVSHIFTCVY